jgi:hypothetical protein
VVASRCEELVTESVIDLIMVVIYDRRALQLCADIVAKVPNCPVLIFLL